MKNVFYILILFVFISCNKKQESILPEERPLTESVYASVIIQPDSLYQAYAVVAGILDANMVEDGDLVIKNEALFQIINNTPKLNSDKARFAMELAQENYQGSATILKSIEDEISAAKLHFKNDSINFF